LFALDYDESQSETTSTLARLARREARFHKARTLPPNSRACLVPRRHTMSHAERRDCCSVLHIVALFYKLSLESLKL